MEQATAVLLMEEGEGQLIVPIDQLPPGSKEGDWLLIVIEGEVLVHAELNPLKTEETKSRITAKRALLLERMTHHKQHEN